MNPFMKSFTHIHRSSSWQPKLQLKLKLHLKLLHLVKPTPPGDSTPLTPAPDPPPTPRVRSQQIKDVAVEGDAGGGGVEGLLAHSVL